MDRVAESGGGSEIKGTSLRQLLWRGAERVRPPAVLWGSTQVLEVKHEGIQPITVEFNYSAQYPTAWHLEGPVTVDKSKSEAAVLVRRLLYYALHWVGDKQKRSIDRIWSDAMNNDLNVTKILEGIRSKSAQRPSRCKEAG